MHPLGLDGFLERVRAVVGHEHVLTAADLVASYAVDWTGRFRGSTPAVVRPGTTAEVVDVVQLAREARVVLVAQGGNTGLVGGSTPHAGEVVLSLRRLLRLDPVDQAAGQVTAGAGVTIAALQQHAAAAGWAYGVDWSARDSATVGGSIATDAGGQRFVRYGGTRRQLIGVEAVLGTGEVISHLGGLEKDNTGYDLAGLVCGSEGTLAVVTAARLRLVPPATERVVALLAFGAVDRALAAVAPLRRALPELEAVELLLADGLELVCEVEGLPAPFAADHDAFLLVEVAGRHDPTPALAAAVDDLTDVADAAVAVDRPRQAELWRYREAHTEAINTLGPPHKLDVTLPAGALADFIDQVPGLVAGVAPGARTWLFGHAADGNVHVNVTGVAPGDEAVDDVVLQRVAAVGGSVSAEHGIGVAKRRWLHLNRSPAEIDAMRAIKAALDPYRILNPHVLLPDDG
ncbi:MAG: linked oxidase domain protein [Acidimicrobiales bacterium]|nr:linked oxidase domain protein [Acidimicrobiales bacterium]